jgi:hypothetical protein
LIEAIATLIMTVSLDWLTDHGHGSRLHLTRRWLPYFHNRQLKQRF